MNFLLSGSVTLLPDNISSWYIHLLLKSLAIRKAKIIALIPNPLGYERTLYIEKSNEKPTFLIYTEKTSFSEKDFCKHCLLKVHLLILSY